MATLRTALSDSRLQSGNPHILGYFSDSGSPKGFAIFNTENENCFVRSLIAKDDSQEVTAALLDAVTDRCCEESVTEICWKTEYDRTPPGFQYKSAVKVYRPDKSLEPQWEELRKKLQPVIDRQMSRGYITVPLSACTTEQQQEITDAYRSASDSRYMESLLHGERGEVLQDISSVLIRDGHMAAYCIMNTDAENPADCQLGYLGCTRSTRNSGAMVSVFVRSIDAYFQSNFISMRFIVNENNRDSGSLMKNHLAFVKPQTVIYEYRKSITIISKTV